MEQSQGIYPAESALSYKVGDEIQLTFYVNGI